MRQDDLEEYLNHRRFHPFRVYLSTGAFVDVRQPQLARVTRSTLTLGLPVEGNQQRFLTIALVHIVWIEILVPAP